MKTKLTLFLLVLFSVLLGVRAAPPEAVLAKGHPVVVNANRVNLRAAPKENGELVGQVNFDDRLVAKSFLGDWVEVVPPASISFYVHSDYLKDNQVTAPLLHVRSGPSVNYTVVGKLVRNQRVVPRGVFNEWIEIAPPENATVWVHGKFVKKVQVKPPAPPIAKKKHNPAPPAKKKIMPPPVRKTPPPAPAQQVKVEKSTTRKVIPPYDLKLIPLEGQGKLVKRQGFLKMKTGLFGSGGPSKYRLEVPYRNKTDLICYVRDEGPEMQDYVDKWVIIQGNEFWVQGEGRPVIVPKAVVIANRPANY